MVEGLPFDYGNNRGYKKEEEFTKFTDTDIQEIKKELNLSKNDINEKILQLYNNPEREPEDTLIIFGYVCDKISPCTYQRVKDYLEDVKEIRKAVIRMSVDTPVRYPLYVWKVFDSLKGAEKVKYIITFFFEQIIGGLKSKQSKRKEAIQKIKDMRLKKEEEEKKK